MLVFIIYMVYYVGNVLIVGYFMVNSFEVLWREKELGFLFVNLSLLLVFLNLLCLYNLLFLLDFFRSMNSMYVSFFCYCCEIGF